MNDAYALPMQTDRHTDGQSDRRADTMPRAWHAVTAVVTLVAVGWQLVLILNGSAALTDEGAAAATSTRLIRFVSYFTILSNLLVALTTSSLALRRDRDTRAWRVLRLNAVVCITVTGVIHFVLLRPLLDLAGASYVVDKLLHVAVPLLAVVGWVAFGPRRRIRREDLLASAVFPVLYMAWTLLHGAVTDWYPYPFVDVTHLGYPHVLLNGLGVVLLLGALTVGAWRLDLVLAAREEGRR